MLLMGSRLQNKHFRVCFPVAHGTLASKMGGKEEDEQVTNMKGTIKTMKDDDDGRQNLALVAA